MGKHINFHVYQHRFGIVWLYFTAFSHVEIPLSLQGINQRKERVISYLNSKQLPP
jgi:hypothetical protein